MKKYVVASLLVCACIVSGARVASAQAAPAGQIQMSDAEFKAYNDAKTAATPQAQATGYEAYLTAFPQSSIKTSVLETLMITYSQFDVTKAIDAADRLLQVDPTNYRGLLGEASLRKASADALTDPAAKQAALDAAASYAQKGLAATKPASMSAADFQTLQTSATPVFQTIIAYDALNKKDSPTAITYYKKELAGAPLADTMKPSQLLQDTFYLGVAYYQSTPPDYLNCAYYTARAAAYAPDTFKAQMLPTSQYCYKKYHGGADGYDALAALAKASLFAGDLSSIKPAPTPADIVKQVIDSTPDLSVLAVGDKEFIIQNGTPDQGAKVWDTVKGKSVEIPGALVIAATPTQIQVAISDDAVQSKTADFTFNMTPPEEISEPKSTATPAQKLAYKKAVAEAQKKADAIAALVKVGGTVTLDGTYDSYTAKPIMITMINGEVVLPKPAKTAPAPVHHAPAHK
jgi:hypothetical protein